MNHNYWIYLLIMFGATYLVRILPLMIFRRKINSRFIRSFLAYIPYAVLAAMTFPAVFYAVDYMPAAVLGVLTAVVVALIGGGLFGVAMAASIVVYLVTFIV